MKNFSKVIRPGMYETYTEGRRSTFCMIEYSDGELSITGVEGPTRNGDCDGRCGQINPVEVVDLAPFWTADHITKFNEIWDRWHLNKTCAGSPAQSKFLREHPIEGSDHYKLAKQALKDADLDPDTAHTHNGEPYSYGSAWLKEDVPEDVLEWLSALPETDKQPAWV